MEDKHHVIKHVSERDIQVGETRIYLDEDNILNLTVVGELDEQIALTINKVSFELGYMVDGKVNTLIDLNQTRKPSIGARKFGYKSLEHEKVGKVALFGLNPVARVLVAFLIRTTRKKEIRHFTRKEEALAWLKERDVNTPDRGLQA